MRITFVLPGWSIRKPVGGFKVVYEYANRLSERGHQINIVHPLLLFPQEARFKQKIKRYALWTAKYFLRNNKVKWFSIFPKVNMLIVGSLEEKNIPKGDVLIATAWQTAEWVNQYDQNKGRKFYLIQGYEIWSGDEKRVRITWKFPLEKITVSKWLKDMAEEMGEQVSGYIPNGLDFDHFRLINPIKNRVPKTVAMLFSKIDCKGSNDGIKALNLVKKRIPDFRAVFFGVSPKGKGIPKWVKYHKNPSSKRLLNIYNSCSIFLAPSWHEGWSLPPAEAMACGCAVVSTDCGGILEYAEHEVNALLSPPEDPQALAQNILRLLGDDDLRMKLARAGYEQIQKFTWDKAVIKLEEVLRQE
jgi:glycosyltransferase involved in cell wall biosynthesis